MNITDNIWQQFAQNHQLDTTQLEQFKTYYSMLCASDELFNLTAITELKAFLAYHATDSLMLGNFRNLHQYSMIADIGTGGGFPAIPLKIKYPHLAMVLIEVTHKKIQFLEAVIERLGLENIETSSLDWRTFLRKTEYPIELFCARASLQPEELLRMFQPSSPYKNASLVYWASEQWQPNPAVRDFVKEQYDYKVGNKRRKLIAFYR